MSQMWAYRLSRPGTFEQVLVPRPPPPPPGWLVARLVAGGICGSDLALVRGVAVRHEQIGQAGRPLHEVVGEVVESADPRHARGDIVVGWATREDGLAEWFSTSAEHVQKLDVPLPPTEAVLVQSVACAVTLMRRVGPVSGLRVAVLGLGPFGLLIGWLARYYGAASVLGVDPVDRRRESDAFGFTETVAVTSGAWVATLEEADRPDLVIEAVGHQSTTVADAMSAVADGGTAAIFGVPDDDWAALPLRPFFRRAGRLVTGVTTEHQAVLTEAQRILREHPELAGQLITRVYPADLLREAFDAALRPASGQRKLVLAFA